MNKENNYYSFISTISDSFTDHAYGCLIGAFLGSNI